LNLVLNLNTATTGNLLIKKILLLRCHVIPAIYAHTYVVRDLYCYNPRLYPQSSKLGKRNAKGISHLLMTDSYNLLLLTLTVL